MLRIAGVVIVALAALAIAGAILVTNHYEIVRDVGGGLYMRLDRWNGAYEMCGKIGDKTYCGADLRPAIDALGEAEYQQRLRYPHGDGCYQAILQHGRKPAEPERPIPPNTTVEDLIQRQQQQQR